MKIKKEMLKESQIKELERITCHKIDEILPTDSNGYCYIPNYNNIGKKYNDSFNCWIKFSEKTVYLTISHRMCGDHYRDHPIK